MGNPTLDRGRVGKSSSLAWIQVQFTLQRSHKIRLRLRVPCSASPLVPSLLPYYLTRFSRNISLISHLYPNLLSGSVFGEPGLLLPKKGEKRLLSSQKWQRSTITTWIILPKFPALPSLHDRLLRDRFQALSAQAFKSNLGLNAGFATEWLWMSHFLSFSLCIYKMSIMLGPTSQGGVED